MSSELLTERRDDAIVLTLSDPATRNTLSPQVYAAGIEALGSAEADRSVRCVILRGDGAHFCAGGQLQRLAGTRAMGAEAGAPHQAQSIDRLHGWIEALRDFPKPVIAAVEGAAAGAGFSLALACDLIVAAEDARFVMSYGRVGLSPDGGATWHLARQLPRAAALAALWFADALSAVDLQRLGLVNQVVSPGQALDAALALAARLAAMAPNAVASAKQLVNEARSRPLHEQLDAERGHFVANLFNANGEEGIQAFLEKRAPRFR